MGKIRNEYVGGQRRWDGLERTHKRLRWFGHARRKYDEYIGRWMLRMELPGKMKRRRPKRRFMDAGREAMAVIEVT